MQAISDLHIGLLVPLSYVMWRIPESNRAMTALSTAD